MLNNRYGSEVLVSVILPCRNEELALPLCLTEIKKVFAQANIDGEIIVSDSSTDNSPQIAKDFGVVLVKHDLLGYGQACLEGFKAAQGKYLILGDADGTYDFNEIPNFLKYLQAGYNFVLGNRFAGKIDLGAMPILNRYLGNPILSLLFRLLFRAPLADIHCGLRAISKISFEKLNLKTTGMEFASEMIIKAVKKKMWIKELPINYYCRRGRSKLKPWADGWRHLRFMLLYSPLVLFFLPGLTIFIVGLVSLGLIYFDAFSVLGRRLQYHPMFLAALLIISGYQLIIFSIFAKIYAITHLGEENKIISFLQRYLNIERASLIGLGISLMAAAIYLSIFFSWIKSGLGPLSEIKNSIVALVLMILGLQTIFSSFMLSILGIKER